MKTITHLLLLTFLLQFFSCTKKTSSAGPVQNPQNSGPEKQFETKVKDLIANKENLDKAEDKGIPILVWAVENNYVESTKMLLENGADANIKPMPNAYTSVIFSTVVSLSYGNNPLEKQKVKKNLQIAQLLIKHGADVNFTLGNLKETVLHKAALRGRTDLCELFIKHGANANAATGIGTTPLHQAASAGYWKTVQFLLQKGAIANSLNKLKQTPLDLANKREDEGLNNKIRKETKLDYNPDADYEKTITILKNAK